MPSFEGEATISIGTTTFTGDGERLFLNFKDVGLLFSHDDAEDFLKAAMAAYLRLGYGKNSGPSGEA